MKYRKAKREDLLEIIKLFAHDQLGKTKEQYQEPLGKNYLKAFEKINNDINQELIVLESDDGVMIGTLQLTYIQYLTYQGGIRVLVEGVRIMEDQRGKGIGKKMFQWAINRARAKGAHLVQLTTDKRRPEALKFYEKLGFVASHEGMKLHF